MRATTVTIKSGTPLLPPFPSLLLSSFLFGEIIAGAATGAVDYCLLIVLIYTAVLVCRLSPHPEKGQLRSQKIDFKNK